VVVTFFGTVENLYVFFSASIVRWEKMRERLEITLKRESVAYRGCVAPGAIRPVGAPPPPQGPTSQ
jgi:hypothetical protein